MIDLPITLAGLVVGFVVGLTGMGGGALMTPLLVLLFGVPPLTAVSSDIVASMVMKPVGGGVHWRSGSVNWSLVKWLCVGSVPAGFLGVLLLRSSAPQDGLQDAVRLLLGGALLLVAAGLAARPLLQRGSDAGSASGGLRSLHVRPLPTLAIGVVGGVVVGLTSVGSGSLMLVLLLLLYPRLRLSELIGTDLVQAVPLVASAAVGHLLFGSFELPLTASILVGSVPGVYLGAQLSARAPDHVIRPALVVVLAASSLKLLGATEPVLVVLVPALFMLGVVWVLQGVRMARAESRPAHRASLKPM